MLDKLCNCISNFRQSQNNNYTISPIKLQLSSPLYRKQSPNTPSGVFKKLSLKVLYGNSKSDPDLEFEYKTSEKMLGQYPKWSIDQIIKSRYHSLARKFFNSHQLMTMPSSPGLTSNTPGTLQMTKDAQSTVLMEEFQKINSGNISICVQC